MKTKSSYEYWLKRQDERLAHSESISNETIADIASVYDDSLIRVKNRIENILDNYSKSIKMPKDQLKDLLSQHDKENLLRELTDDLVNNRANTKSNMDWVKGNYLKRLTNQESIKLQLENERRIISRNEKTISTRGYKKTISDTYSSMSKDLTGKGKSLSESAKNSMLTKRWVAGRNYSERIWNNTGTLSTDLDKMINSALLSGASKQEIVNELAAKYDVGKYRAEALVRTEMNYFENQTELKSYQDMGVTHYSFLATRDSRTSLICSSLDNERFAVEDAKPGINYPPMHTNCRSGTVPDLEFEDDYRVYKNPITGQREKTTKPYDEWLQNIEENAEKEYNIDRDKILENQESNRFASKHKMTGSDLISSLSVEELDVIENYSNELYGPINKYLRGIDGQVSETLQDNIKILGKALGKHELQDDTLLMRGVSGATLKQLEVDKLGITRFKGFTSTSINPNTSKQFMNSSRKRQVYIEIIAPEGTKGLYISELSHYPGEMEFLLPHNTVVNVEYIKEKEGYTHVKARIVNRFRKKEKDI